MSARLLHDEGSLGELETLVDEDDGGAPPEYHLPSCPAKRHDTEDTLKERSVEEGKVKDHGKTDGVNENHVLPERKGKKGLG